MSPSTQPAPPLLVVAPDAILRRSLAFMLEAEGFFVIAEASWPPSKNAIHAHVVVIDHGALPTGYRGDQTLRSFGDKVLILAGRERAFPALSDAVIIRKPLLENVLIEAVRLASEQQIARPT